MPIVETPEDALQSLLACNNDINSLFMGNFEVTLRPFPFTDLDKIKVFIYMFMFIFIMFMYEYVYMCGQDSSVYYLVAIY
jgi:hypothetical protein